MKRALALSILMFGTLGLAQQSNTDGEVNLSHAPTVEQCRADAAVWEKADYSSPSMSQLFQLSKEMNDCMNVDPAEKSHELFFRYATVNNQVHYQYTNRLVSFLDRHSLRKQFLAEDKAGKR